MPLDISEYNDFKNRKQQGQVGFNTDEYNQFKLDREQQQVPESNFMKDETKEKILNSPELLNKLIPEYEKVKNDTIKQSIFSGVDINSAIEIGQEAGMNYVKDSLGIVKSPTIEEVAQNGIKENVQQKEMAETQKPEEVSNQNELAETEQPIVQQIIQEPNNYAEGNGEETQETGSGQELEQGAQERLYLWNTTQNGLEAKTGENGEIVINNRYPVKSKKRAMKLTYKRRKSNV